MSLIGVIASGGAGGAGGAEPPLPYKMPDVAPYNAPIPTITPTYDGSGQAIHPGVLDFRNITPAGVWHGWRFWMSMTPYPAAKDPFENPSILVSNDGFTWHVPDGLTNPLYPWPGLGTWNYDFDIEYDPDTDSLWGTFNTSDRTSGTEIVSEYMVTSPDGITWPATKTPLNKEPDGKTTGSVGLVRRATNDWWMFGMVTTAGAPKGIGYRRASDPAGPWGPRTVLAQPNLPKVWHWDVIWDGTAFRALMHDGGKHLYAGSWDGQQSGFTWNTTPVLSGSNKPNAWDGYLYRSSLTMHQNGTHYRVWYTGRTTDQLNWGVGYTWLPRSLWPAP